MHGSMVQRIKLGSKNLTFLFRLGLIILFAVLLANYLFTIVDSLRADEITALDFMGYYNAATAINQRDNPYTYYQQVDDFLALGIFRYGYPPTFATLLTPLASQSIVTAQRIWLVANQVFFVVAALLSIKACNCRFSFWQLLLIGCLMLGFYPIYPNLKLGNVSMLLYMIVAMTFWFWQKGNRILAAVCLALGITLKLIPILLALYFLWKREYLLVLIAALLSVLFVALPDLLLGTTMLEYYVINFFQIVDVLDIKPAHIDNQSLYGFFARLWYWVTQTETISEALGWLNRLLSFIALILILFLSPRNRPATDRLTVLEFGLILFLFPVFSTNTYTHYYVWILLIIPTLVHILWDQAAHAAKPEDYLGALIFVVGFAFMSQPYRLPRILGYDVQVDTLTLNWFGLLLQSIFVYGSLAIAGVTAARLLRNRTLDLPVR